MNEGRLFYSMLKLLFKDPCLVLMIGNWRQGKTDTSLLIANLALKWKIIDKVGSNIWTFEHPDVSYITNLPRMKRWLHADKFTKLFIFDEAMTHLPSREAMSKKNVSMMKLFTELSKAHGRMIFCSQSDKVDSSIKDQAFLRAVMFKHSRKKMSVSSNLFPPLTFRSIPRSPIRFDKDRLAEFSEKESLTYSDLSVEYKVALSYVEGKSFGSISKEFGLHKEEVRRTVKKVLRLWIESQRVELVREELVVQPQK